MFFFQHSQVHRERSDSDSDSDNECTPDIDDEICDIALDQATMWKDALNDDDLEEVRSVSTQQPQQIDTEMDCDIQVLVGRLISKAPQLLGKYWRGSKRYT